MVISRDVLIAFINLAAGFSARMMVSPMISSDPLARRTLLRFAIFRSEPDPDRSVTMSPLAAVKSYSAITPRFDRSACALS